MSRHLHALPGSKAPDRLPERILGYAYPDGDFEPISPGNVSRPHRRSFDKEFVTMFTSALIDTAASPDLSGSDLRVLMYLMGTLGMGNRWQIFCQRDIATAIGVHYVHVNRAIKKLVKLEVLLKGDKIGRGFAYSLNPLYGWKGTIEAHKIAAATAPSLKLLAGGKITPPDDEPTTPEEAALHFEKAERAALLAELDETKAPTLFEV